MSIVQKLNYFANNGSISSFEYGFKKGLNYNSKVSRTLLKSHRSLFDQPNIYIRLLFMFYSMEMIGNLGIQWSLAYHSSGCQLDTTGDPQFFSILVKSHHYQKAFNYVKICTPE